MTTPNDTMLGRCIGGDFDVQRPIAAGGVGSVYEAVQRSTGKMRAVKLMHAWLASDEKMRARFVDEARIAGSVESDHVVEVVSAGIDPELGVPWIAMELLRGQTLADYAARVGPMSRTDCLEVLAQARHGLQLAHSRSLVHRDLKPDNIFVADPRRLGVPFTIKVLDFGIAKWVQDVREGDQNSQAIGTPSWMAPEQLSNAASITPATDVWALGLLAFWMLTGREYWIAANDEKSTVSAVLLELVTGPRASASERVVELGAALELPPGFDDWFARCVDLEPSRRFSDAGACVDALELVLRGAGVAHRNSGLAPDALPNTAELDAALEGLALDRPTHARAHARTAAVQPAPTPAPRATARRLEAGEIERELWAGDDASRGLFPLSELLLRGLSYDPPEGSPADLEAADEAMRGLPDPVQEAIRHVCLVLGVHPAATALPVASGGEGFSLVSLSPRVLGVPGSLAAEPSGARLRAHAAVAVARTLPAFAAHAQFGSPGELEDARKAAVAFARGAVSSSRHFRPLVSNLGARRGELREVCAHAEGADPGAYFRGVELTVARLALLCAAERGAALAAARGAAVVCSAEELGAELDRFERAPVFESYFRT